MYWKLFMKITISHKLTKNLYFVKTGFGFVFQTKGLFYIRYNVILSKKMLDPSPYALKITFWLFSYKNIKNNILVDNLLNFSKVFLKSPKFSETLSENLRPNQDSFKHPYLGYLENFDIHFMHKFMEFLASLQKLCSYLKYLLFG